MSLLPAPLRHRTVFEAISDLAAYQYDTQQLLSQLVTAQTANAANQAGLLTTLGHVQTQVAAAVTAMTTVHQQIATGIADLQKTTEKPTAVTVEGTVHMEAEQRIVLAETRKLSPVALLAILTPLHRLEQRLADIRIAENHAAREAAMADYALAVREFDELIAANRHLKALKPQTKGLTLKIPGEGKEVIESETLEKISILHVISASAVALHVASQNPKNG